MHISFISHIFQKRLEWRNVIGWAVDDLLDAV